MQTYDFPSVTDRWYLNAFYRRAKKLRFDVKRYNELRNSIADVESELRRHQDLPLDLPLLSRARPVAPSSESSAN